MTDEQQLDRRPSSNHGSQRGEGHHDQVWDLVSVYGPDVTGLCRAGSALMSGIEGVGLSAGALETVPRIRFYSDEASSRLESAQVRLDEGPCRDATASRRPVLAADLATESWRQRWLQFTPAALDADVRAVFALPLHAGGVRHGGAVDLYRHAPGPLNSADQNTAAIFTAAAAELLTLERHGLNLTEAFAHGWRSKRSHDPASAARLAVPTGKAHASDRVLLVCWFGAAMLGPIRTQIRDLTTRYGLGGEHAHQFTLAVQEAVTNAVRHGGGHGQLLLWRRTGRLWCEISDHGFGIPTPISADTDTTAGPERPALSGLQVIRRACTSVDITTDTTGTRLLLSRRLDTGRC